MPEPTPDTRLIAFVTLGERLASLRLCDATALAAVRGSLERYGQLTALTLFVETDQLEILDGFKRVRAARALGWTTLLARIDDVDAIEAKLRVAALHDRRGLELNLGGPSLVIITGKDKPFLTTLSEADYAEVRQLGSEYRARKPRSVLA